MKSDTQTKLTFLNLLSTTIILILIPLLHTAQNQGQIWYFGENAGITFSGGAPVALTNSSMTSTAGCASISNAGGNLLFYTNGESVWDKNHQLMPNGSALAGNSASTQSAIIVPQPGSANIYYIFTADAASPVGSQGISYSVVDLTYNSGNGDVTLKNINLIPQSNSTEKLAAVRHSNGRDVWVVTHLTNSNAFYAWLVGPYGLNTTPVISTAGLVYNQTGNQKGQIQISHNGQLLASAVFRPNTSALIEMLNFDACSGAVSTGGASFFDTVAFCYGVEFSPDDTKLYTAGWNTGGGAYLYQYDLSSGVPANITASKLLIAPGQFGAIETGKDNKLYIARDQETFLSAIDLPNVAGSGCNFSNFAVSLSGRLCRAGLPAFIKYPQITLTAGSNSPVCEGDTLLLTANFVAGGSYSWTGPNGFSSTLQNPKIGGVSMAEAGNYIVTLTLNGCPGQTDTIQVVVQNLPVVNLGSDVSLCQGSSITFDAGSGFNSYQWNNGSSGQTLTVSQTGNYSVTVTNACGSDRDTVKVISILPSPQIDLGNDTLLCYGDQLLLDAGSGFATYQWQNGSSSESFLVTTPGTYWVSVTNSDGCEASDTLMVNYEDPPELELGGPYDICQSKSIKLDAGAGFTSYLWQDGSKGQYFTAKKEGTYYVTVKNSCGSATDSAFVEECPECIVDLPTAFTPNNDGRNDKLMVVGNGYASIELSIYNRHGEIVFFTKDPGNGWDGTYKGVKQENEVYAYTLNATCLNGRTKTKKGFVTLFH